MGVIKAGAKEDASADEGAIKVADETVSAGVMGVAVALGVASS